MRTQVKRHALDVGAEQAWAVLSDIRTVASCMPGAAITEQFDATHYKGTVKLKVGPASMLFGGAVEVLAPDAAAHSLRRPPCRAPQRPPKPRLRRRRRSRR